MRYMLFGGETWYPQGGAQDLLLVHDDLQIVMNSISPNEKFEEEQNLWLVNANGKITDVEWFQVLDTKELRVIVMGRCFKLGDPEFQMETLFDSATLVADNITGAIPKVGE